MNHPTVLILSRLYVSAKQQIVHWAWTLDTTAVDVVDKWHQ